jgi:hypothetical protein
MRRQEKSPIARTELRAIVKVLGDEAQAPSEWCDEMVW